MKGRAILASNRAHLAVLMTLALLGFAVIIWNIWWISAAVDSGVVELARRVSLDHDIVLNETELCERLLAGTTERALTTTAWVFAVLAAALIASHVVRATEDRR